MKQICRLISFLVISTSTFAFGAEALICNVQVNHPNAEKLIFIDHTSGVRLVSDIFNPATNLGSQNSRNFEIALEENGNRHFAVLFDRYSPIDPPLSVSLRLDSFYGDNNFESLELNLNTQSLVRSENKDYYHSHISDMFCYRAGTEQKCLGNFGYENNSHISNPETYFSYSLYCRPMLDID